MSRDDLYMRYLGVLGILAECSVQVDEETREQIQMAFDHACNHHPLQSRRILNRIEIEARPE
jgi:hypothetical protein